MQVRPTAFPKAEGGRSGGPAAVEAVPEEVLAAATAAEVPKTTWIGEQQQQRSWWSTLGEGFS